MSSCFNEDVTSLGPGAAGDLAGCVADGVPELPSPGKSLRAADAIGGWSSDGCNAPLTGASPASVINELTEVRSKPRSYSPASRVPDEQGVGSFAYRETPSSLRRRRSAWVRPEAPSGGEIGGMLPNLDEVWRTHAPELVADRVAVSLRLARDRIALPLAQAARSLVLAKAWFEFGYARLEDHARERFGRSGRWVRDLAALGEASERLPGLAAALTGEDGGKPVGRVLALLIGRIASAESCREWIDLARTVTVREFREEVRSARLMGRSSVVREASPRDDGGRGLIRLPSWGSAERRAGALVDDRGGSQVSFAGTGTTASDRGQADFSRDEESLPEAEGQTDFVGGGEIETAPSVSLTAEDDVEEKCTVRFALPPAVRSAFDEAHDLHDALSGGHGTMASFIEALTAEACAGPSPPLDDPGPYRRRLDRASRETLLARATDNWRWLTERVDLRIVLAEATETLREIDRLCGQANRDLAADPDARIRALARLEDEVEQRLGDVLAEMSEGKILVGLSFAGIGNYAEERLGIARATAEDRARLARALRAFPALREAYEAGRISQEAASAVRRVLGTVAPREDFEATWVEHAAGVTVKRLRDELRLLGRTRAEQQSVPRKGLVDFPPPNDAVWHGSLLRQPGQAIERVGRYGRCALEAPQPEELFRLRLPLDLAATFLAAVKSRVSDLAALATQQSEPPPWTADGAPASLLAARTFSNERRWVPEWVGLLAMIEEFVATWDDPRLSPKRAADPVYRRDGWRCMAPGCTSRENLDEHHVVYRSRGGPVKPMSNRLCCCRFHHLQGEHGELATCRGVAPLGIIWWLGRRGIGGCARNERRV